MSSKQLSYAGTCSRFGDDNIPLLLFWCLIHHRNKNRTSEITASTSCSPSSSSHVLSLVQDQKIFNSSNCENLLPMPLLLQTGQSLLFDFKYDTGRRDNNSHWENLKMVLLAIPWFWVWQFFQMKLLITMCKNSFDDVKR